MFNSKNKSFDFNPNDIRTFWSWPTEERQFGMAWMLFTAVAFGVIFVQAGAEAYEKISKPLSSLDLGDRVSLLASILLFGLAASYLKFKKQILYGYLEICFALAFGWNSLGTGTVANPTQNLLVLVGVMYLVSRGTTNILDGLRERKKRRLQQEPALR